MAVIRLDLRPGRPEDGLQHASALALDGASLLTVGLANGLF